MEILSHREFIDDATVSKIPDSGRTKEGKWTPGIVSNIAVTYVANQVFGCLSYNRETYDYRQRDTPETGGAVALMVTYTESGPKTDRPVRPYVGRSGELVNSISPRISSRP